jgi:replicative DNA helicase
VASKVIADNDAERYVLGSMLHGRRVLDDPDVILDPADFNAPKHETIAAVVLAMHANGTGVDPITVAAELAKTGDLARVGGAVYLADLYGAPATTANAAFYASQVRRLAIFRRAEIALVRSLQVIRTVEGDPAEAVEIVRGEIDSVMRDDTASVTMIADEIDDYIESLEAETTSGVATPWPDLNFLIGGWRPGRLYVVGSRPSVGKSILGLQAALGLARHGRAAFYSLEMPRDEVRHRIVAQIAGVQIDDLERPGRHLSEEQWARISRARGVLADLPLAIDDRSMLRPVDIRAHARTLSRGGVLSGLVVDYLQLMSGARGDQRKRYEQVGEWSRSLKLLAKELDVPVIVLSQLNREIEHRSNPEPTLADLRESGSIEQDADVVILLHPVAPDGDGPDVDDVRAGVAKNRQGRVGMFTLVRRGEVARFDSKARPGQLTSAPAEERYR